MCTHSISLSLFLVIFFQLNGNAQKAYNLQDLFKNKQLEIVNRACSFDHCDAYSCITLNQDFDEGLAWLKNTTFSAGTIDIDLKGKDLYQHSFIGIAFHGQNDTTFQSIYFRPFQFLATDSARRQRMIQYVNLPADTWQKLRANSAGEFESAISPVPDPNAWFHVQIVVTVSEALVYVNHAEQPCFRVRLLSTNKTGKIGLYTADQSGGTFANLVINETPSDPRVLFQLAAALKNEHRYEEAVAVFKKLLTIEPEHIHALTYTYLLLYQLGQKAEANVCLQKAEKTGKADKYVYMGMANTMYSLQAYTEGVYFYEKLIGFDPSGPNYYNLACGYARLNQNDKAFENLNMAIQKGFNKKADYENDSDLAALKSDSRWQELLMKLF